VHTLAGPLFVASWSLFSASDSARWFAAAVPFLNGLRLVLAGTGITSSEGSVRSMTRHGDRAELLRGPLYYVLALVVATLLFWRVSPISACAVAAMCGGDGLADIVGRRSPPGSPRIPWNKDKTLRGSSAMFAASLAFAVALVWLFTGFGYFAVVGGGGGADAAAASVVATAAAAASHSPSASASASAASSSLYSALFASFSAERAAAFALAPPTLAALAAVAFAATAVESLPANAFVDDNVSVPAVAMALGWWLFERSC
jgi:phytol kinase